MTQKHIQMKHTGPNGEIYDVFPKTVSDLVTVNDATLTDVVSGMHTSIASKANASHTHTASQVTFTDGLTFQQKLDNGSLKGQKGDTGAQGPQGIQGPKGDTGAQGIQGIQGPKGDKGDQGNPFVIKKAYASVSAMNADFSNSAISLYDFVIINSNVDDPDNSKLYMKGATAFEFVTDLSGATGIQGPKGDTGATGATGPQGPKGDKGETGAAGIDGITPTIKAGTVTTGAEGTNASVTANTVGTTPARMAPTPPTTGITSASETTMGIPMPCSTTPFTPWRVFTACWVATIPPKPSSWSFWPSPSRRNSTICTGRRIRGATSPALTPMAARWTSV